MKQPDTTTSAEPVTAQPVPPPTPPLCGTCRHWLVRHAPTSRGYGECQRVQHLGEDEYNSAIEPIWTGDIEGCVATVYTLPTFGCVLHEPAGTDPGNPAVQP